MRIYFDSSALLRILLRQPDAIRGWEAIEGAVSSELLEVECLRTLDRMRLLGSLAEDALAELRATLLELLDAIDLVEIDRRVLSRATEPFPTILGTLDAIHLSTALLLRNSGSEPVTLATHDVALGRAARAVGLAVFGS